MEKTRISVLVADRTRISSRLLADAIQRARDIEVVASVSTAADALRAAATLPVAVALVSPYLDQEPLRGFELVRELRVSAPQVRPVMLLDVSQRDTVVESFRAGARGIFSKNDSQQQLVKCIRCVHEGQIWATTQEFAYAIEVLAAAPRVRAVNSKGLNLLSKREVEVVQCLSEGLTNREIGRQLGLSRHTVKNYLLRIFDKLGASNRMELLFLTLSQPPSLDGMGDHSVQESHQTSGPRAEDVELHLAMEFEQGLEVSRDPASAYMWCLVAERKSQMKADSIAVLKASLERSLDRQQLADGCRKASEQFIDGLETLKPTPRTVATK